MTFRRISSEIRSQLMSLISDKLIIPCYRSTVSGGGTISQRITWKCLGQTNRPCLADADLDLAEKFVDKINVAIVNANAMTVETDEDAFVKMCRFDLQEKSSSLVQFWLDVAQLKRFSSIVILDLENITESLMEAPAHVQNRCRRVLPFVQCFLATRNECKPLYERLKSVGIKEKLEKLKFYR